MVERTQEGAGTLVDCTGGGPDCNEVGDTGADLEDDSGSTDDIDEPSTSSAEADWLLRSGASGVTMATNFATPSDVFDFAVDDPRHYEWSTDVKASGGGALRILINADEGTSGHDWWRFLDDGMEPFGSAESDLRDEYWLSYRVYLPDDYYNWVFDCAGSKKLSITSSHPWTSVDPTTREPLAFTSTGGRSGSSVVNEVVVDDFGQRMIPSIYRKTSSHSAQTLTVESGGCDSSDFRYHNATDAGPQSGTPPAFPGDARSQACLDWTAQYGPTYRYAASNGGLTTGAWRDAEGQTPFPDPIAAGPSFKPGWNTILYHLRFPTTWTGTEGFVLELYLHQPGDDTWVPVFARYNDATMEDPSEVDNGIPVNGGRDGYYHWGLWLTPFRTGGQAETGVRPDTYVLYDEVIVSTAAIAPPAVYPTAAD